MQRINGRTKGRVWVGGENIVDQSINGEKKPHIGYRES